MNIYETIINKARSERQRWDMENDFSNPKTALNKVGDRITSAKDVQADTGGAKQEIKYFKGLKKALMNVYARMEGTDKSFEEVMRDDDLRREAVQGKYDINTNKVPQMDPTKEDIPDYLDRWKRMLALDKKFGPYFTGQAKKDQEQYEDREKETVDKLAEYEEHQGRDKSDYGEALRKVKEDRIAYDIMKQVKDQNKDIEEAVANADVDYDKLHNNYNTKRMTSEEAILKRGMNETLRIHNSPKSFIPWPGGKSRAVKHILPLIPKNVAEVCAPFLGGGSLELAMAKNGIDVYAGDNDHRLTNLWKQVLKNPKELANYIQENYFPSDENTFKKSLNKLNAVNKLIESGDMKEFPDPLEAAAMAYMIIRNSFGNMGLAEGGKGPFRKKPRGYTDSIIKDLEGFKADGINVESSDYKDMLKKHSDMFLYLDPPYDLGSDSKIYGTGDKSHMNFDHKELAEILKKRSNWILSYNDTPLIRELYNKYKIEKPKWSYGMGNQKGKKTQNKSNEVIIMDIDE